jgi:hypothetical protein
LDRVRDVPRWLALPAISAPVDTRWSPELRLRPGVLAMVELDGSGHGQSRRWRVGVGGSGPWSWSDALENEWRGLWW